MDEGKPTETTTSAYTVERAGQRGEPLIQTIHRFTRRELVFLALGTMDVCVITPIYVASLAPLIEIRLWSVLATLLAAIIAIHYLARLSLSISINVRLRSLLIACGVVLSGLLTTHRVLYARIGLWEASWLGSVYRSLRQTVFAPDSVVFLLVAFLWWRGLALAQRRLDSRSVAFRFRLGVVLLAVTTGIAGSKIALPYHHLVFLFFFTSLLGIALARAEEVGQQYGGRQTPFDLGWLTTIVITSTIVLALAAGLTSVLTGRSLGRALSPVLHVVRVLLFVLVYAFAWAAQFLIEPLIALLQRYEIGRALADVFDELTPLRYITEQNGPNEPIFTPEQLEILRLGVAVLGAGIVLLLIAISLYRLQAKWSGPTDEERESVWEGVQLQRSLSKLFERGRQRLNNARDALAHSGLGHRFTALTIRRIYAHTASLAADRGFPRAIDETPYDYLPALERAFPENREDIVQITESYVAVHYGELPERQRDLAVVRSAWRRIRQQAANRQRKGSSGS